MALNYFFDNKYQLVSYLMTHLTNATPLKVQKAMYFLWAFYAATYGNINYDNDSELNGIERYPEELFEAHFEALQYGPVIYDVYLKYKGEDECTHQEVNPQHGGINGDVWLFINDIISQIDKVYDFGLVLRSCQDSAWRDVYNDGSIHRLMDNKKIKEDYINYVNEQSKL